MHIEEDKGRIDPSGIVSDVDVSVCVITYFHEDYLRQCIESVLSQQTHYRYEIVISDDCSQDATPDIVREYAARYPDIIIPNINEVNLGIPGNIFKARTLCRGRYITSLSGDDYWINDAKLETEIRFLDDHPEYVAAACRVEQRMEDSEVAYDTLPSDPDQINAVFTVHDYEKCKPLGTHGIVFRNYFLTAEGLDYFAQAREISRFVDDAVDEVLLLRLGPIYMMDIISDAHRVLKADLDKQNYNSRYSRPEKFRHHIELLNGMSSRWGDEIDFSHWYANYCATGILGMIISQDFKTYKPIFASIPKRYKKRGLYIRWIPYAFRIFAGRIRRIRR